MLSDVLWDAARGLRAYRKDYPEIYGQDPRMNLWLDALTTQLEAAAEAVGAPPPEDDRTHRGECRECHEITTIRLDRLTCQPCADNLAQQMRELVETAVGGDPDDPEVLDAHYDRMDAEMAAAHAEFLAEDTLRIVNHLKQLSRADRDHILAAIDKELLEAR